MKKSYLALALLAPLAAWSQPVPGPYLFAADIVAALRAQPERNQPAALQYAAIRRYQAALEAFNQKPLAAPRALAGPDSLLLARYQPADARAYILQRAQQERIIMLNEAHHVPRHRAFAAALLPGLAAQGYRYLAVEDLLEDDSLNWTTRRYPVQTTGSYVGEPQMAGLLRTAQRLGFQLRCYNYGFSREGDWVARVRAREQAQARHIQRILQADPQAKIVVYCGYSHASEQPDPEDGSRWLASYLREYTGIDPFTIDQTRLSEGNGNAYYQPARLGQRDAVLLDAHQQPFNQADKYLRADAHVYHPPTRLVQDRPDWLFTEGRQPVAVGQRLALPLPYQVRAYVAGEPDAAVPVDVVEVSTPADAATLALAPGRYRIVARSQTGQLQTFTLKR